MKLTVTINGKPVQIDMSGSEILLDLLRREGYFGVKRGCENGDCGAEEALSRRIDANVTGDLFLGYTVKSKAGTTALTVGVNNITDQDPPLIYSGFLANSDASTYDYLGRYFYTRLNHSF